MDFSPLFGCKSLTIVPLIKNNVHLQPFFLDSQSVLLNRYGKLITREYLIYIELFVLRILLQS